MIYLFQPLSVKNGSDLHPEFHVADQRSLGRK